MKNKYFISSLVLGVILSTCFIRMLLTDWNDTYYSPNEMILTVNGLTSLSYIEKEIYNKYNYEIINKTVPFTTLKYQINSCSQILRMIETGHKSNFSKYVSDEFLFFGHIAKFETNSTYVEKLDDIWEMSTWLKQSRKSLPYDIMNLKKSLIHYKKVFKHKTGIVMSNNNPWIEVLLLQFGAKHITSIRYNSIIALNADNLNLTVMKADDFSRQLARSQIQELEQFDFIVAFNFIEKLGLNLIGDTLNALADLQEIQKIRCILKPGGLLFVQLPIGRDSILWNSHRVYGRIRLSMLFAGFDYVTTFNQNKPAPITDLIHDLTVLSQNGTRRLHVLRKT